MSDAFLVLAQTDSGVSCFLVPRWRPDGTKNPLQVQCLKHKMGNVSNASSETELRGALGWMVGTEGHGIATILEMVAMTRFDCVVGSAALMRQAVVQITHHCAQRVAFGNTLARQPLMQNVLADLILESEAALALAMRLARALDHSEHDSHARQLLRLGTALGKYWVCKRAPAHVYEAMECLGGSGVMEDCMMPRLYREAPVNAIWEGSGNVQCLDMLRVMHRHPEAIIAVQEELQRASGRNALYDARLGQIRAALAEQENLEYRSRQLVGNLALQLQAAILLQDGDALVADAFCAARLGDVQSGWLYGTLPATIDCASLIGRASLP
jgi:putative acyl-CoA dehydrogenase